MEDDGIDAGPIPIRVPITVAGDRLLADFTGTAPQVKGAINSPLPFTKSAVYACVRHLIGGDPPNNEGYFRPIEVDAPEATIVNPVMPAPVAARGLTGFRVANALFGACYETRERISMGNKTEERGGTAGVIARTDRPLKELSQLKLLSIRQKDAICHLGRRMT